MAFSPEFRQKFFTFYRYFIPCFGIVVGLVKVFGVKGEVALFHAFGVSDTFRVIFGLVQAGGAILLFFPRLILPAALLCILTLVAASGMMAVHGLFNVIAIPLLGIFLLGTYIKAFAGT